MADSLFYKKDVMGFENNEVRAFLTKNQRYDFKAPDSIIKQLNTCLDGGETILDAYFYSNYSIETTPIKIVFVLSTMESNFLIMATVSESLVITSCVRLTEDSCDLINQDNEKEEIWCDSKNATLMDPTTLKLIYVHEEKFDYGTHSTRKKDSITLIYGIEENILKIIEKDSIRTSFNLRPDN
jgi:hypothetical protein